MVTVTSLYICISYIYTYSYNFLISYHLYIPIVCHMFSVFVISPIYTFTIFMCFVIFYLSLSFLALMHFYHVFLACSISSFRYVYHIFISYMTFMVICYTICYVLCSCTVHVLCSCTHFIYCFPVILFILLSLSCIVLVHILFVSLTLCFLYLYTCHTIIA